MNALRVLNGERRWSVDCADALKWLKKLPDQSVDYFFADPPFNIGYKYDVHDDMMIRSEYLHLMSKCLTEAARVVSPVGSISVAINDENVADLHTLLARDFTLRNWIIWHYTFGTHQKKKFGRSKTHILHFVKHPKVFTFNADAVRIKSRRQEIGDKRADPRGRVPGDVWTFSRVCGTFKERTAHPCQMPESVLERCIKAWSNPDDIVADPFAGSGTTLAVAHRLGRRAIGCEISKAYCKAIEKRLS